ncbi:MAG: ABC transporter substrate-binding protein [Ruthenibacterium sp.]
MKLATRIFSAAMASLMALSLTACGAKAPASVSAATSAASQTAEKVEGVTLTYVVSQNWVNKGSTVDDDLNKKFEEETGIKIDMQVIPDDQYVNVLKTKLSTGEVPDMFMVSGGVGAQKFMPEKYFADLSNEEWVSRYAEYATQGTTIDGKIMGLMRWNVDGWGIVYNKELYEQLGIKVPTTGEEFTAACDTLLANGITPVFESGKDTWHWGIWLSSYGPYAASKNPDLYQKLNTNEVKFADVKEFEDFLNEFKGIYDKGYLGKNCLANAWDASYGELGEGKSAGFLGYQSYQNEVAEKYPDCKADTWEMYPIPIAGNNMYSHSAGGNMTVAYKDSKNLEYVKQFFNFLTQPENLTTYYAGRADLQSNPSFTDVPGNATAAGTSMVKNATGGEGMEMEYGVLYWDNTQVGVYMQEMLLGNKTAKEVLESIDGDRQKMFDAQS